MVLILSWGKSFTHYLSLIGKGAETTERGSAGHVGQTSPLQLGHWRLDVQQEQLNLPCPVCVFVFDVASPFSYNHKLDTFACFSDYFTDHMCHITFQHSIVVNDDDSETLIIRSSDLYEQKHVCTKVHTLFLFRPSTGDFTLLLKLYS